VKCGERGKGYLDRVGCWVDTKRVRVKLVKQMDTLAAVPACGFRFWGAKAFLSKDTFCKSL